MKILISRENYANESFLSSALLIHIHCKKYKMQKSYKPNGYKLINRFIWSGSLQSENIDIKAGRCGFLRTRYCIDLYYSGLGSFFIRCKCSELEER